MVTAFSRWESYSYHEDRQVSALMETYLSANHARNHYPYSYEDNRDFLEKIKDDAEKTAEEVLDKLCGYA